MQFQPDKPDISEAARSIPVSDTDKQPHAHDVKGNVTPPAVKKENVTISTVEKRLLPGIAEQQKAASSLLEKTVVKQKESPVLKQVLITAKLITPIQQSKQLHPIAEVVVAVKNSQDETELENCFKELNEYSEDELNLLTNDSSFMDILDKHAPLLTANNFKNLFNLAKDEVLSKASKAVIKCLDTFEKHEEGPVIFQHFTMAVGMSGIQANEHLAAWGDLADAYLDIATKVSLSDADKKVAEAFRDEITHKRDTGGQTYEWFVLFNDRLSILMTKEVHRDVQKTENGPGHTVRDVTQFAEYKTKLMQDMHDGKPSWHTPEGYTKACNTIGDEFVRTNSSPLGLSKKFPNIVMMPYPFDLTVEELLLASPVPGKSNFWALGCIPDMVVADGWKMPPAIFMTHDMFHLTAFLTEMGLIDVLFKNKAPEGLEEIIKRGNELYYNALTLCKDIVKGNPKNDESQKDQAQMDVFFGFLLFHEGNIGLRPFFDLFTRPGGISSFIDQHKELFQELTLRYNGTNAPFQYADAIPKSLLNFEHLFDENQKKTVKSPTEAEKRDFMENFKTYGETFIQKFRENSALINDFEKWKKSYDDATRGRPSMRVTRGTLPFYGDHVLINVRLQNEWRSLGRTELVDKDTLKNAQGLILRTRDGLKALNKQSQKGEDKKSLSH